MAGDETESRSPRKDSLESRSRKVGNQGILGVTPDSALTNVRQLLVLSVRDGGSQTPLGQHIFDELAIAITEGRLQPGQTLDSVSLARLYGTSRTPVRDALAALEHQGVVVVPPRRRPYVAGMTAKHVKDIYSLRTALFGLVSELIIENRAPLDELWQWQDALDRDAAAGDVDAYFWHNVGFRLVEVRLAANTELQRAVTAIGVRGMQLRHMSLSLPGQLQRSAADHRRLLIAYEDGDVATATAMTRALMMGGYRALVRAGVLSRLSSSIDPPAEDRSIPE